MHPLLRPLLLLPLLFLLRCGTPPATTDTAAAYVTVTNPLERDRTDAPIVVSIRELNAAYPVEEGAQSAGAMLLLRRGDGTTPPQQLDDLDGDGQWDELALVLDLAAGASERLELVRVDSADYPTFPPRTSVRLGIQDGADYNDVAEHTRPAEHRPHDPLYHVEGVSWENDLVGFRNYFDERNGKDIFGKRVPDLVLDTVDLQSKYHELHDWGMDILKVGNSLGAGALAARLDGQLYRLGPTATARYRRLARGPVRSVFRLDYTGWEVGDRELSLSETITITPGNYAYHSAVTIDGPVEGLDLVTGIVNLHSEEVITGLASEAFTVLATHDRQSYIEDGLGMAVVARGAGAEVATAPEEGEGITQTFYVALPVRDGQPNDFYFLSGWETSDAAFAGREGFLEMVRRFVEEAERPVSVEVGK